MPRGGYQKPPARTGPGGPGKFSKRTDGMAPPKVPPLDSPDMQYGDVQRLKAAQQIAPIGKSSPSRKPTGAPVAKGQVPPFLLEGESAFPAEPVTAGLPVGAGPGPEALSASTPSPDIRESVLEYFYFTYGNMDAYNMLYQLREEQAAAAGGGAGGSWGNEPSEMAPMPFGSARLGLPVEESPGLIHPEESDFRFPAPRKPHGTPRPSK